MKPFKLVAPALLLLAAMTTDALAAGSVTIIRGTHSEAETSTFNARGSGPIVIRGMKPEETYRPSRDEESGSASTEIMVQSGNNLWLRRADGSIIACSLRGSGMVDSVSREIIVCTDEIAN